MTVMETISEIIRDILDDKNMIITMDTTARDCEDWDSLAQLQIIIATERRFNIRFITKEIKLLKTVGDFVSLVDEKLLKAN